MMNTKTNRKILLVDDTADVHRDYDLILAKSDATPSALAQMENQLFGAPTAESGELEKKEETIVYDLVHAMSGEEAVECVRKAINNNVPFATIFLDVRMPPGIDGIEAAKQIWEIDANVEIVISTAYMDYSHEYIVKKLGITDRLLFIKKPFDTASIRQMALTTTTKWNLSREVRRTIDSLEFQVNEKTKMLIEASKFAALGQMAGGIAHEINTPLAVISMACESMDDNLKNEPVDIQSMAKNVERVAIVTQRIANIIRGLLQFARSGRQETSKSKNISELIDETLFFCRERIKLLNIDLQTSSIAPDLFATCQPAQISQVILNLLNNSVDAIENLPEKWIRIEARATADSVEILVTDSGGGLTEEQRKKIFEPFYTTKAIGKGTGLGLSISLGIIEAHRGKIEISKSCPNTQFIISLPAEFQLSAINYP